MIFFFFQLIEQVTRAVPVPIVRYEACFKEILQIAPQVDYRTERCYNYFKHNFVNVFVYQYTVFLILCINIRKKTEDLPGTGTRDFKA
jgi:hypothetical protein